MKKYAGYDALSLELAEAVFAFATGKEHKWWLRQQCRLSVNHDILKELEWLLNDVAAIVKILDSYERCISLADEDLYVDFFRKRAILDQQPRHARSFNEAIILGASKLTECLHYCVTQSTASCPPCVAKLKSKNLATRFNSSAWKTVIKWINSECDPYEWKQLSTDINTAINIWWVTYEWQKEWPKNPGYPQLRQEHLALFPIFEDKLPNKSSAEIDGAHLVGKGSKLHEAISPAEKAPGKATAITADSSSNANPSWKLSSLDSILFDAIFGFEQGATFEDLRANHPGAFEKSDIGDEGINKRLKGLRKALPKDQYSFEIQLRSSRFVWKRRPRNIQEGT